ncbi:MAG: hypothetical protein V9G19_25440 [Tetrasphaera sp.]
MTLRADGAGVLSLPGCGPLTLRYRSTEHTLSVDLGPDAPNCSQTAAPGVRLVDFASLREILAGDLDVMRFSEEEFTIRSAGGVESTWGAALPAQAGIGQIRRGRHFWVRSDQLEYDLGEKRRPQHNFRADPSTTSGQAARE